MLGGKNQRHDARSKLKMSNIMKVKSHMIGKKGKLHPLYGKKHSPDSLKKIIIANRIKALKRKGTNISEETREKIKKTANGRKFSPKAYETQRKTYEYIESRKWKCTLKEAKKRLILEAITLLTAIVYKSDNKE